MDPHYDDEEDDFFRDVARSKKSLKEDVLDETFKKAEILKGMRPKEERKLTKKPFRLLGVVLISIAIISILIINLAPWMYIKYDAEYGTIEEFYYRGFENKEEHYYREIDYIFESPCTNCSNNSKNFIGITKDDFTNIPRLTSYGFFILIALGVLLTVIELFFRMRNLSMDIASVIHSMFAAASVFVGVFVMFLSIKFIGLYFLLYYNMAFIEASGINSVVIVFLVPIILIIISALIMRIAFTVMKINFREFENKLKSERTEPPYSTFENRSKV